MSKKPPAIPGALTRSSLFLTYPQCCGFLALWGCPLLSKGLGNQSVTLPFQHVASRVAALKTHGLEGSNAILLAHSPLVKTSHVMSTEWQGTWGVGVGRMDSVW